MKLRYNKQDPAAPFGPEPKTVAVKAGDTLEFSLHADARKKFPGSKLRISMQRPKFFSAGVVKHGDEEDGSEKLNVVVKAEALGVTTSRISFYSCELLEANGTPIPGMSVDGASGGEIVPDTGGGE